MEEIRKFVDEMITWAGVTGDYVPMLRHILLTVTAILLAMLSDFLCRKIRGSVDLEDYGEDGGFLG